MRALGISAVALFLNPDGTRQLTYPFISIFHQPLIIAYVEEWKPVPFTDARGIGLLCVLLGCLLMPILRRKMLYLDELLLLLLGAWMGANHQRLLFVFGILAAPIVTRLLANSWESYDPKRDRMAPNAVMIALPLLVAYWAFPAHAELERQVQIESPVKAVEFIQSHHLAGPMLNDFNNGGYFIWAMPEHQVFIDGRADVFEWTGVLKEFGDWTTLQSDPNVLLEKYKINFCALSRSSEMVRVLALLPNWKMVYEDGNTAIFQRS